MKVLDLCAGTKSATAAFRDRGHTVETLDIAGDHTYVCDVRSFFPDKEYDFVWASPPCTEFSLVRGIKCRDRHPDMSIVDACLRICKTAPYWALENPRGCLRYFIGKPVICLRYGDYGYVSEKPTDLWGEFPWFFSQEKRQRTVDFRTAFPFDRSGRRSQVPYGLSLAICRALESISPIQG